MAEAVGHPNRTNTHTQSWLASLPPVVLLITRRHHTRHYTTHQSAQWPPAGGSLCPCLPTLAFSSQLAAKPNNARSISCRRWPLGSVAFRPRQGVQWMARWPHSGKHKGSDGTYEPSSQSKPPSLSLHLPVPLIDIQWLTIIHRVSRARASSSSPHGAERLSFSLFNCQSRQSRCSLDHWPVSLLVTVTVMCQHKRLTVALN